MAVRFDTTSWSLILHASGDGDGARTALEALCSIYRPPVLAYVRARRGNREEAEDLTQAFFAHLLEHRLAARADRERGRFRAFLLTSLKYFVAAEFARDQTQRRGGGIDHMALDECAPADGADSPEQAFEREWARTVLREAMARLRKEAQEAGKDELFLHLQPFLIEAPDDDEYAAVANTLGMRRNTLAVAVHRLRTRLQELVRAVVADTVNDTDQADQELRRMRAALTDARLV